MADTQKNIKVPASVRGRGIPAGSGAKPQNTAKTIARLFKAMGRQRVLLIPVFIAVLISAGASLSGTYILKPVLNEYIIPFIGQEHPDLSGLAQLLLQMAAIFVCGALATYLNSRIMLTLSTGTLFRIRTELFSTLERLPLKYFDTHTHGELMSLFTNDTDTLRDMFSQSIPQLFTSTITIIGAFTMMLVLSPQLTLISAAVIAVMVLCIKLIGSRSASAFRSQQRNLGRGQRLHQTDGDIRKSIFSGLVFCTRCGHALCSCGTVYKGEREKYWYLSCTHQRGDIANRCDGVRIKYADLVEVVRRDLNALLALDDTQAEALTRSIIEKESHDDGYAARQSRLQQAQSRLLTIDKIVTKLYTDNAEGKLDDDRLARMVQALEQESASHQATIDELKQQIPEQEDTEGRFRQFFALGKQCSQIDTLDRETLLTFIERIEVGPKQFENGLRKATHRNTPYRQDIRICYRFIGALDEDNRPLLAQSCNF